MLTLLELTEGWTAELGPFVLTVDGQALDLTGMAVTLLARGLTQATYVDAVGDVRVDADQVTKKGHVYWKPDAADLPYVQSPYAARFKVVDGLGDVLFVPNGEPRRIVVHRP